MRNITLILLIMIILSSVSVLGEELNCKYKDTEPYEEFINVFYENGTKLDYDVLEAKDLVSGTKGQGSNLWPTQMAFKIYNNYNEDIDVTVHYLANGHQTYQRKIIGSGQYFHHQQADEYFPEDISYTIHSPEGLESKWEKTTLYKPVCKTCCDTGVLCLEDGQTADSDCQCGSDKRNVNGICISKDEVTYIVGDGICHSNHNENCENSLIDCSCGDNAECINKQCVSDCSNPPEGKDCCQGEFRSISSKDKELPCDCDFECKDNLVCSNNKCVEDCSNPPEGMECCNNIFKKIGSKSVREAYSCDWECKTGYGEDNICKEDVNKCPGNKKNCNDENCLEPSTKEIGEAYSCVWECKTNTGKDNICKESIIIIIIKIILFVVGVYLIILGGKGVILHLKNKHEKEKQKTYENEIVLLRERQEAISRKKDELEKLKELSHLNKKEKEKIRILLQNINKETSKMEKEVENKFKVFMKPYPSKNASGKLVFKNPYLSGYECFYDEGLDPQNYPISKLVHRWVWKKHNGKYPRQGYHIHHIDEDKYNNNPENLEEIEKKEHYEKHRRSF